MEAIGFQVIGVVSDMGGFNQAVWKQLNITPDISFFLNPFDDKRKVYYFADIPHLIKLMRNHFVDSGFLVENGEMLNKTVIEKLLQPESHKELKISRPIMS